MNKRNVQRISPRPFPKQQYRKLTHKIGLSLILPILIILIGGGIGSTYYYHNATQHRTYQKVHRPAKKHLTLPKHVNHKANVKPINVKQGEHLLGHWLKQLHYSDVKAQTVLTNYQKQNKNQDLKISQQLNHLTHNPMNNRTKIRQIRHLINNI